MTLSAGKVSADLTAANKRAAAAAVKASAVPESERWKRKKDPLYLRVAGKMRSVASTRMFSVPGASMTARTLPEIKQHFPRETDQDIREAVAEAVRVGLLRRSATDRLDRRTGKFRPAYFAVT